MDIQIIALWIGLFITFVLGLINFLWGPAILARRDKVIIREPRIYTSIVEKDPQKNTSDLNNVKWIAIQSRFKLVRTKGEQDLYLESTYLKLNKALCKKLSPYFEIPLGCRIHWSPPVSEIAYNEAQHIKLKANEPREFDIYGGLKLKSVPQEQVDTDKEINKKQNTLVNLEEKVKELETEYEIVWIDGRGKKWRYKLPIRGWLWRRAR